MDFAGMPPLLKFLCRDFTSFVRLKERLSVGQVFPKKKGTYSKKGGIYMNKIERLIDQLELLEYLLENRLHEEQDKFEENFSKTSFHLLAKIEKIENKL